MKYNRNIIKIEVNNITKEGFKNFSDKVVDIVEELLNKEIKEAKKSIVKNKNEFGIYTNWSRKYEI